MNASTQLHAEQEILLSLALFDNSWDHVFITAKHYQCKPGKEETQHFPRPVINLQTMNCQKLG